MRLVPNKLLREAFLKGPRTASELPAILGYEKTAKGRKTPDQTAVLRALGLKTSRDRRYQEVVREDKALAIADVLGLDPVDIDL